MKFKTQEDTLLFTTLASPLIMIYADLHWYAKSKHNVELVVTATASTLEQDKMLNRKSSSHRERRALDIRTNGIDSTIIADLVSYINNKSEYKEYHYLSSGGKKRLAYWHNSGHGDHLHLALHSKYKMIGLKSE